MLAQENSIAQRLCRGVCRALLDLGYAPLCEFRLACGRRADVFALSDCGEAVIVEIKSSVEDFRTDQKWPEYAPYCDRFYFAVDCDFPKERLPEACGMMVCDGFGGAILRECAASPLNAARRKAVTLSFARLAAARLMRAGEAGASPSEPAID